MKGLFWGFILVYLNCNLPLPTGGILNVLPPWAGFILLFIMAGRLAQESHLFLKTRPWSIVLAVYGLVLWVVAILKIDMGIIGWVLAMASIAAQVYLLWLFICAIRDVERNRDGDLGCKRLRSCWVAILITSVIEAVSSLIPPLIGPAAMANMIAILVFLVMFHGTCGQYRILTIAD